MSQQCCFTSAETLCEPGSDCHTHTSTRNMMLSSGTKESLESKSKEKFFCKSTLCGCLIQCTVEAQCLPDCVCVCVCHVFFKEAFSYSGMKLVCAFLHSCSCLDLENATLTYMRLATSKKKDPKPCPIF